MSRNKDYLDRKLNSMPKPDLSNSKKQTIHEALMKVEKPEEGKGLFTRVFAGAGGLVVIASLVAFVFMATLLTGDEERMGPEETEKPEPGDREVLEYYLIGESDNWSGEFYFYGEKFYWDDDGDVTSSAYYSDEIRLTYKGELVELATIEELEVSYQKPRGSNGSMRRTYEDYPPDSNEFTITGGGSGMNLIEDDTVHVTVKWGDMEESFEINKVTDVEEWEKRGFSLSILGDVIKNYITKEVGEARVAHAGMGVNEQEDWILEVMVTEMLDEELEKKVREMAGDLPVVFKIAEYTEEELWEKYHEIETIVYAEEGFSFEGFDFVDVGINPTANRVEIWIHPFTEENIQHVYDLFGEEMLEVVDSGPAHTIGTDEDITVEEEGDEEGS
ncbi:MAG: hypothetical protein LRY73_16195 [Bacillus sp. (in: Bacteria)]|nr:hypothetical protein [Bacillus sp. (in: firmicutes)]